MIAKKEKFAFILRRLFRGNSILISGTAFFGRHFFNQVAILSFDGLATEYSTSAEGFQHPLPGSAAY